jgi:type II secretory pathway pseudopilin PulG
LGKQLADVMPPQMGVGKQQAMRNGQNKRMRGRNRKGQNPLTRVYESNGPDVKIRGTASHIADKYIQLARDAQASGDPVGAENYFQHAEHYFRLIAAAQEQFRQANPYYRPEQEARDDFSDETEDEAGEQPAAAGEQPFGTGEPQPYLPREAQPFPAREQPYGGREHRPQGGRSQQAAPGGDQQSPDLPAFITGGAQPQPQGESYQGYRQPNGFDGGQGDRFPLHRRRRRHRGPRGDQPGASQSVGNEPSDDST